jgi:hypothetical protein
MDGSASLEEIAHKLAAEFSQPAAHEGRVTRRSDLPGLDVSMACTLPIFVSGLLTEVRSPGLAEPQEASVHTKIPWNILFLLTFYRV